MRNERGITLIALALTVGLVIILAGVSLNIAFNENNAVFKKIMNEDEEQQQMIKDEETKMNSVISSYEEEWGLS